MPVAMKKMGSIGPTAMQFVKDLGSRIIDVTGDKMAKSYLFQRLGMAVRLCRLHYGLSTLRAKNI